MEKPVKFQRQEAVSLSGPLRQYLNLNGLWYGLYRNKVFETWDSLSGAGSYTINKYLKDNILYITLSSSALRNKLQFKLPFILQQINETVAADELFAPSGEGTEIAASITKIILR